MRYRHLASLALGVLIAFAVAPAVAAENGGARYSPITPAQGGGCPGDAPLACPGTNRCCPSGTPYYCQSLTRPHPEGRAAVGWSGCVMPGTAESFKFWSSACQPIWEKCN
jgi:hypothetical protein